MDALKKIVIEKELMPKRALAYKLRTMMVIPEQHFRRWIPDAAAETETIRQFAKERFYVVDQSRAAQLGKALGAEAIVFGSVDGYVIEDFRGREKITKHRKTGRKVKGVLGQMVDETRVL